MDNYYNGQPIRINAVSGSWGTVLHANHFGGLYVEFNYGKDVKGDYITSCANVKHSDIIPVDPNVYTQYIKCRAWSDEQKQIHDEYLKTRHLVMDSYEVN